MTAFTLDGTDYQVNVLSLQRKAAILDGENAGRTKSGMMVRDIIGTYYNYTLEIDTKSLSAAQYDALYESLTAPVDSHTLVVPYGQNTIRFQAYISNAEDTLRRMDAFNLWGGLKITFTAVAPYRR